MPRVPRVPYSGASGGRVRSGRTPEYPECGTGLDASPRTKRRFEELSRFTVPARVPVRVPVRVPLGRPWSTQGSSRVLQKIPLGLAQKALVQYPCSTQGTPGAALHCSTLIVRSAPPLGALQAKAIRGVPQSTLEYPCSTQGTPGAALHCSTLIVRSAPPLGALQAKAIRFDGLSQFFEEADHAPPLSTPDSPCSVAADVRCSHCAASAGTALRTPTAPAVRTRGTLLSGGAGGRGGCGRWYSRRCCCASTHSSP